LLAVILSNALDTNGQNARYVSAARKHGEHERIMKALAIGNYDPAGVAERFRLASEKLGGLELRAAHRTTAYFDFPIDMVWTKTNEREIREIAAEADPTISPSRSAVQSPAGSSFNENS